MFFLFFVAKAERRLMMCSMRIRHTRYSASFGASSLKRLTRLRILFSDIVNATMMFSPSYER